MSDDEKKRDRALQRRVRERMNKTGESYQAAWRQLTDAELPDPIPDPDPENKTEAPDEAVSTPVRTLGRQVQNLQGQIDVLTTENGRLAEELTKKTLAADPSPSRSLFSLPWLPSARLIVPLNFPRVSLAQPTRVTSGPTENAVDITRVYISNAGTEQGGNDWVVNDIEIDGRSQLTMKNLSGALFSGHGVSAKGSAALDIAGWDVLERGQKLTLVVTYIGKNPEGCPFFAAAVGMPPRQRPTVVPIATGSPIAPTAKGTIRARVQSAGFHMERLTISNTGTEGGAADWIVNDLRVNGETQFNQSGDVPGDLFHTDAIDSFIKIAECQAGGTIEIEVTYIGLRDEGVLFKAELEGTVLRDDYTSAPSDLHVLVGATIHAVPLHLGAAPRAYVLAAQDDEVSVVGTCDWRAPASDNRTR